MIGVELPGARLPHAPEQAPVGVVPVLADDGAPAVGSFELGDLASAQGDVIDDDLAPGLHLAVVFFEGLSLRDAGDLGGRRRPRRTRPGSR